ncbi:hypothetical protein D1007_20038 [Hordeum vulgare]|nr:hypothetical protein D1007_20038 [Hordeum vulgare]
MRKVDLHPAIDRLAGKCSGWKIDWITSLVGRVVLVRSVLSAIPAFQMIAIPQARWLDQRIDKTFHWAGKTTTAGGKCLVNWKAVCRPTLLTCLVNLESQGAALRVRWLWQQAKFPDKPWTDLPFPTDKLASAIFMASTTVLIDYLFLAEPLVERHPSGPLKVQFPNLYAHSRGRKC